MKKILLAVLLSLACYSALAGPSTPTLGFTPPTTRENGAPISQSEIKHYEVYATHTDGTLTKFIIPGSHSVITLPKAGTYTISAVTVDTGDRISKPSNSITFVVDQSAPGCPTDLKIVLPAVDPTGAGR